MDADDRRETRRVLVLGGAGFIGRQVVAALQARGHRATIGSRHPERAHRGTKVAANDYRRLRMESMLQPEQWHALLADYDAVVNCVGILRQRGRETYDRVHHRAPAALAAACTERGLRLVHVSALGFDRTLRSRFLHSKHAGEQAVMAAGGDCHVVRPSLLDGEGGFGARWLRRVARWPLHPVPRGAIGKLAVLDVRDLGEAIANLVLDGAEAREHDLGGLQARTLSEHLAALRALHDARPARTIAIPDWLAALTACICDILHWTPLSFGHWELLQRDNCPRHNSLPALLGRAPRTVGATCLPAPPLAVLPARGDAS